MNKKIISFIFFFCMVLFYCGCGETPEELAAKHIREGNKAVNGKNFIHAMEEYSRALEITPDNALVHYNMAYLYETEIKDVDQSVIHYRKAMELLPNKYKFAIKNIAKVYYDNGRYDEAVETYREAVKILPNDVLAHNDLGAALIKKGMIKEAIEEFEKAIEIDPTDLTAVNNRDKAYIILKRSKEETEQ